jgi:hypothetical protein
VKTRRFEWIKEITEISYIAFLALFLSFFSFWALRMFTPGWGTAASLVRWGVLPADIITPFLVSFGIDAGLWFAMIVGFLRLTAKASFSYLTVTLLAVPMSLYSTCIAVRVYPHLFSTNDEYALARSPLTLVACLAVLLVLWFAGVYVLYLFWLDRFVNKGNRDAILFLCALKSESQLAKTVSTLSQVPPSRNRAQIGGWGSCTR